MLQSMRTKIKGVVAFFLIALLSIPLALVGVESLFLENHQIGKAAEVAGEIISEREVQLAIGRERQRLQAQIGAALSDDLLSDERLRTPVIESLVERSLIANLAKNGNMTFSDGAIDQRIVEMPDFQIEGNFDSQRFIQIVRSIAHTPTSFRDLLREDLLVSQMQRAVLATDFITSDEIDRSVALSRQTRDFSWITLPLGDLQEKMVVSDEEISKHYESNKDSYLSEEQVAIEFIELNIDQILVDVSVTEDELRDAYQQIVDGFIESTEREAAHIMVEEGEDSAQKIAEIQSKLAANEDFASLAKEYSDDFGSRDNGGNLGVSTGDSFPEAFEEALALLEPGQVSAPVDVDGATHFIKLLSINESKAPSFEEQRVDIENDLNQTKAEAQFIQDVEALRELSYNAESLQGVAEQLGVSLGKTDLFSRSTATDAVLRDARVLTAAFSEQVVQQGYSSDVLELSDNKAMVVKMLEHKPVRELTLDEKRADILAELTLEKAKQQLTEQAENFRQSLQTGTDIAALAEENGLQLDSQVDAQRNAVGVPSELLEAVFTMPHPDASVVIDGYHLNNGDYVLVSLSKVLSGSLESLVENERASLRTNLSASLAGDEYRAWQQHLRAGAAIEIFSAPSNSY